MTALPVCNVGRPPIASMNFTILRHESLDSTNTEALRHARQGTAEGLCVIAGHQTAGRGRYGRRWASPSGAGLYFSVLLRPKIEERLLPLITLMTGVAVCDTLAEFGLRPDIKWVNDVLVNEKKIAGILAEAAETETGLAVAVGIGINLRSSGFPPEIVETATSVEAETKNVVASSELEETLVRFLDYFYAMLESKDGRVLILKHWQRRSSYFSGKSVIVRLENETITGTTEGLELNGALRVRKADGGLTIIQAGDVEHLRSRGLNFPG